MALLDDVKMALRVSTDAYDAELNGLIESAKLDLGIAGVVVPETLDAVCETAIKTYCKMRFGTPDDKTYAYLKSAYDEQKAQLSMATGYTDFSMVQ
jgi:hypothetical protein